MIIIITKIETDKKLMLNAVLGMYIQNNNNLGTSVDQLNI